jgi:hypothetical protein
MADVSSDGKLMAKRQKYRTFSSPKEGAKLGHFQTFGILHRSNTLSPAPLLLFRTATCKFLFKLGETGSIDKTDIHQGFGP